MSTSNNVIQVDFTRQTTLASKVISTRRKTACGLLQPATTQTLVASVEDHAAEPIKSMDDIYAMSDYFIQNGKYRDNMLFILGINFGLRVSDLLSLHFSDLIDEQFRFKESFPIWEMKTRNTRKRKQNRYITINDAVVDAVILYLEHTPDVSLDDYLFRSESRNRKVMNEQYPDKEVCKDKHLSRQAADEILKSAARAVGIEAHVATHSLRKTFGLWQMVLNDNDPRMLLLLQKMFGHSTSAMTLNYIGITKDEIADAYKSFNLGGYDRRVLQPTQYKEA